MFNRNVKNNDKVQNGILDKGQWRKLTHTPNMKETTAFVLRTVPKFKYKDFTNSFESVWTIENVQTDKKVHTFEEAITEAGNGQFQFYILIVCGICVMGVVVEGIVLGFALPAAKCDLKFTIVEQGILNSVGFIGIVLSSHFWGFLADTWGRLKVLRLSLIISCCWSLVSSFSISVAMLIVTRFFVGLFISGVQATSFSYLGEFHGQKSRIRAVTFAAMFMPFACVYLPALAWLILPMKWTLPIFGMTYLPWRLLILVASAMNFLAYIAFQFLPESPKFLLSMEKVSASINVLKIVYNINTKAAKETYHIKDLLLENVGSNISNVKSISGMAKLLWNQTWPLFVPPHLSNTLKLSFLMFILFSIGHGSYMWTPDIFTSMIDYIDEAKTLCDVMWIKLNSFSNETVIETTADCLDVINPLTFQILLGVGIAFAVIYGLMALYIDRIGRKLLLTVWLTMTAASCLSIAWSANFYATVVLFVLYLSCGLCGSVLSAISVDLYPTNIRAMALCLILMFGRLGSVAGSNLVGALIATNCNLIFFIYTGLILMCVGICFFIKTK